MNKIIQGDSLILLAKATPNSIDAIVTDPPYGLSFMGKKWDYDVPSVDIWKECYRVLKPGGYLLSFAGTRTQHRMAVNIEDAGFEIRDMIAWVYGSGFPKSLNIGKAVDKLQGNEREYISTTVRTTHKKGTSYEWAGGNDTGICDYTKGNSEWEGWGTALKPALEPITVARKPLSEKNVAENVLKWGTGGINIDGSRVGTEERYNAPAGNKEGGNSLNMSAVGMPQDVEGTTAIGRFPANLIHDGSDEVIDLLNDSARFFYCAKASKADRDEGLEGFDDKSKPEYQLQYHNGVKRAEGKTQKNSHPTVKPTKLMQYLVKLVTPPKVPYCPNCANVLELGYGTKTMQELQQPNNRERQTGQTEELLQQEMRRGLDGETEEKALDINNQGLSPSNDARTPESEVLRVHNATSPSDGTTSGEVLRGRRSSTSPERNQGRQQGGESTSVEETSSRQITETQSKTDSVSTLPQNDKSIGACQKCGEALAWKKGVVLDCFMGSGSTGKACKLEGFDFIGIELDPEYCKIAETRINAVVQPIL